ncbi:unnamed protein product [Bursaphelenchus okinawaensis]|uniref:Abnormal cell migration protein 18-like fibronectin type I domain-containing protein n=1 Tax=Bursaphelenchus okinawaensis TaxID=465554 RepID=A0A811K6Y3_9BILA|nr:unnamed protein product [Bursaphelenchus okinawaensis]CAG9092773.1 unnamed protein product [Bursaphelenchus okinawaensis]
MIWLLLALTVSAETNDLKPCWSSNNRSPAQFWPHGEVVVRDDFVYDCKDGELVPKGCKAFDGATVELDELLIVDGRVYKCMRIESDPGVDLIEVGCTTDGITIYNEGDTWLSKNGEFFYTCERRGSRMYTALAGCMVKETSKELKIGERIDLKNYTLECKELSTGGLKLLGVGCVHDGQKYFVGEQWMDNDFVFYCKRKESKCEQSCIGCAWRNRKLYDGDRFRKDHCVYECIIRPERHVREPVACVVDGIERVIGCTWKEDMGAFRLEETCEVDGDKTKVTVKGCFYPQDNFDLFFIPANSYAVFTGDKLKKMAASCRGDPEEPSTFELETFSVDEVPFKTKGLSEVEPQG